MCAASCRKKKRIRWRPSLCLRVARQGSAATSSCAATWRPQWPRHQAARGWMARIYVRCGAGGAVGWAATQRCVREPRQQRHRRKSRQIFVGLRQRAQLAARRHLADQGRVPRRRRRRRCRRRFRPRRPAAPASSCHSGRRQRRRWRRRLKRWKTWCEGEGRCRCGRRRTLPLCSRGRAAAA